MTPTARLCASIGSKGATLYPNSCSHNGPRIDCTYTGVAQYGEMEREQFMHELVKRYNEYEALNAVAEAAKDYSTALGQRELATYFARLNHALAHLTSIQKGQA